MNINIPTNYIRLCSQWYNGVDSVMYSISLKRKLKLISNPLYGSNSDEEWMYSLLEKLHEEIIYILSNHLTDHHDIDKFKSFGNFVDKQMIELESFFDSGKIAIVWVHAQKSKRKKYLLTPICR